MKLSCKTLIHEHKKFKKKLKIQCTKNKDFFTMQILKLRDIIKNENLYKFLNNLRLSQIFHVKHNNPKK